MLPKLPPKKKKREASIDKKVRDWLYNNWDNCFAYELKIKGNKLEQHQEKFLNQVVSGRFVARISDTSLGKNPFDGYGLINCDALVIICDINTKQCTIENIKDNSITKFSL